MNFKMTLWCRRVRSSVAGIIMITFMCTNIQVVSSEERDEPHKYTIDELLSSQYDNKDSGDLGMDPCKADNFQGDIAIPDVDYFKPASSPPAYSKINKSLQEEVERLKKEVLLEGLQVEEEGLPDILRKRTKQPIFLSQDKPKKYNDAALMTKMLPPGLDKSILMKNGKYPPGEVVDNIATPTNQSKIELLNQTAVDNLTEYESLEQDGVLVVNISTDNILNLDELYPHIQLANYSSKMDEVTNKIQSNSREISGDLKRIKDLPDNVTVAPAPTNGVLSTNDQDDDNDNIDKAIINNTDRPLENKFIEANDLLKPTESLQMLTEEKATRRRRRRRRHGNRRRLRNVHSTERFGQNTLKFGEPTHNEHFERKKFFRHQKKYNSEERSQPRKYEIPEHEFEEKFEVKPPPKPSVTGNVENQQFKDWFFRDTSDDLDAAESRFYNISEIKKRHRSIRAATNRKERIWENGVIPYEIDGNFSGAHKSLFKQAMRHWENFTCVKFVERDADLHRDYIVFTERPCGCCSFVGKRGGGAQAISIGKNCDKFGIVVHELGHVVGFWHEHTRPDRDNHVQIIRDNIMTGQEYNFNKLTNEEVNSLGQTYDYDSIMHYARNTFSKGTYLDTILPLEVHGKKRPEIGQRVKLSASDIAQTNLLYKCAKCGRTLLGNSGWFNSPGWGSESSPTTLERCEWRIVATHGERVVLNITEIDIHKSEECRSEWVEVRDGYMPDAPVLGRICGSGKGPMMRSSGSRLTVVYQPGPKSKPHRGFKAHYEAVCGGDIEVDSSGHLESPNYPDDYQPNKLCIWRLTVPQDYQVALRFHSFEVENHDTCSYDKVKVRDGDSVDSPLIGMFCGHKIPPDIRSTSNKLLVIFESDSTVQKAGFSATFMKEFDECASIEHGCSHSCVNTLGGYECACDIGYELHSDGKKCENACGGALYGPNGTITSPSFPDLYPPSKNCLWEIVAPPQHRITLNFTHFDLEGNSMYQQECEYDSVTVHSKLGADVLRRHGAFCGNALPPPVTSDGSVLRVQFTSDASVHRSGFAAVYYIDVDECADNNGGCQHECHNTLGGYECACHSGFTLHPNKHDCKEGGCKHDVAQPHGTIVSPNYPDLYPSRKDCVWQFSTTPGHRIKLIFNVFELEPHQECAYDHVSIYDGASADEKTLGRFCGSKLPHPVVASQNQMYVVFKSDASVQRKGFLATHSTACGGYLAASESVKHLYSHARYGDDSYESRADCDWSIVAPMGQFVKLTFLTFELEPESNCGYDYVQIFGGLDGSGGDYGAFCGTKLPTEIISTTEALLVRFRTDDSIVFKGFSASYQAVKPEISSEEDNSEGGEDVDEEEEDERMPPLVVGRRGLRAPLLRYVRRPT
ncbi:tolloid-like protein 1 [Achroia grisella]|uniref:tolloid-like protein 1 n=1 Tax=Achroia grisella TaxID=688607 RepID=UPI0027D2F418|nr:tolloid-like protein 1 [Achroia grisella]